MSRRKKHHRKPPQKLPMPRPADDDAKGWNQLLVKLGVGMHAGQNLPRKKRGPKRK